MARDDMDQEDEQTGAEFEFALTQGRRHNLKALVLFVGHSGSGKTYSAMRLARGLVGPNGKIGVLDTEHNRALHYANEFEFMHATMSAPFSPERYKRAVEEFERQGVDCMIVDSMSHVQEGEGGLIDMAAEEEKKASGRSGNGSQWNKPKAAWKKARDRFLQSKMHIIFCARAKNPLEADPDNPRKMIAGEIVPIMPKNFVYEVTVSLGIDVDTHQLIPFKLPNQIAGAFPLDEYITEESGEMMRQWLDGEKIVDRAFEALKEVGREQAAKGLPALKSWFESLEKKNRIRLKDFLDDELKPLANGTPPRQAATSDAGASQSNPPARNAKPPASTTPTRDRSMESLRESAALDAAGVSDPPPHEKPKKAATKLEQPKREEPPPPDDDGRGGGGGGNEFDFEGDEGEEEPLPKHDYPAIRVGKNPNWSDIAGEICDFIEGNPADVDLLQRVYKDVIKQMEEAAPRTHRMVLGVVAKAKA